MLWRLAWRNVKKSYRDYFIYFLTLSFSICLFYTFNSFESQSAVMSIITAQTRLLKIVNDVMILLSIFVAIILGFLILYASHYLIRRRKKEIATYMILGMSIRDTTRILTIETLLIGLLSLLTGLIMGLFVSQLMGLLTAQMFLAEVSQYHVFFSFQSFMITVLAFCLIFFIVICFYQIILRRYSLRTLLQASAKSERLFIRNIPINIGLFCFAIGLLVFAYHTLLSDGLLDVAFDPLMLGSGLLGTFLFFFSLSGFFLKFFQMKPRLYFKNLNIFVLRQLHASINSSFLSISIVCLMLLLGIGALASGFAITQTVNQNMTVYTPVDISLTLDTATEKPVSLQAFFEKHQLDYTILHDIEEIHMYSLQGFSLKSLWKYMDKDLINTKLQNVGEGIIWFIPLSDYQAFQRLTNQKPIELQKKEVYIGAPDDSIVNALSSMHNQTKVIPVLGQELTIKNKQAERFLPYNSAYTEDVTFFVVHDDWLSTQPFNMTQKHYNAHLEKGADTTSLEDFSTKEANRDPSELSPDDFFYFHYTTKDIVYQYKQQTSVIYCFVGIYLGFVFLLSSVVLLSLHQLTAAEDNKQRYMILRKMGVSNTMINRSIYFQIAIYFFLPLSLALVHSYVGIAAVNEVVILLGKGNITITAFLTTSIVSFIYITYFYAVYKSYRYILKKEN